MLAGGDRTAPPTACRHTLGSPENREDVMAFGERILGSNRALISSNSVSGHATRILKIADQRLGPKSRSVQLKMPKFASQRPHHAPRSAGNTRLFSYRGHGLQRRYCLAGHVGLELRNVAANYPFETSHRFSGDQAEFWPQRLFSFELRRREDAARCPF